MSAEILRGDPECNAYKAIEARVAPSVDPTAAVDVACFMTTDTVDADDEIVLPSGADLSRFEKNPVLLLCHGYGQPGAYHALPIGRVAWTKKRPNGILAGVKFARSTAMGRDIKALFEEGMLRSFSIGFRSVEASPLTRDEANTRPDWRAAFERTRGRVLVHRRWQLLELSAVPLPANPEALVASYEAKGRPVPAWLTLKPTPEARMKDETPDQARGFPPGVHVRHEHGCGTIRSLHTEGALGQDDGAIDTTDDDPVALVNTHDATAAKAGAVVAEKAAKADEAGEVDAVEPVDDEEDDLDEESFDEDAGDDHFGTGDHVTIKAPRYEGVGVVQSVHRRGHVPHVSEDLVGTPCDPAARVKCYKAMGDGHVPTEHHVGVRCAHLAKRPDPLRPPSTRSVVPSHAGCGHKSKAAPGPAVDPLPPLEALSDEDVQRQTLDALGRIPKLVDDAIARYMGVV